MAFPLSFHLMCALILLPITFTLSNSSTNFKSSPTSCCMRTFCALFWSLFWVVSSSNLKEASIFLKCNCLFLSKFFIEFNNLPHLREERCIQRFLSLCLAYVFFYFLHVPRIFKCDFQTRAL